MGLEMKITRIGFVIVAALLVFGGVAQAQAPSISPSGIVNSASLNSSLSPALAPGSLVSIFGANLSRITQSAAGPPFASQVPGSQTKVLFGTVAAPLLYVSPNLI